MSFIKVPTEDFNSFQIGAGAFLRNFNPASPAEPSDEDYISATTGGFQIDAKPEFYDLGEDVDNCPVNMKEFKRIKYYTVSVSTTMLTASVGAFKFALGCADIDGNKVTPRKEVKAEDFDDLWWVGERADGGLVAVRIMNALSTGGLSIKSTKDGKLNASVSIEGHYSMQAQDTVPVECYSIDMPASQNVG